MRSQLSLTAVPRWILLTLLTAAPAVHAQARPDIFVTPVPNAPFHGVVQVERSVVARDGSLVNLRSIREIGRDSQGRIHNESRVLLPASGNVIPAIQNIHLYDPVSRTTVSLYPANKTFFSSVVNHPPSTEPPQLLASPTARSLPQNQFTHEEDLGMHEISGLPAHGVRETQTIPAESSGSGKEIVITDEYWYSEDLRINLMLTHSDPRTGSVIMTVTQLNRNEPAPAFFEVPADYTQAGPARGAAR